MRGGGEWGLCVSGRHGARSPPGRLLASSPRLAWVVPLCRRAYQRAVVVPTAEVDRLWKEYEQLENAGSNKTLARRVLDEWRPKYQAGALGRVGMAGRGRRELVEGELTGREGLAYTGVAELSPQC